MPYSVEEDDKLIRDIIILLNNKIELNPVFPTKRKQELLEKTAESALSDALTELNDVETLSDDLLSKFLALSDSESQQSTAVVPSAEDLFILAQDSGLELRVSDVAKQTEKNENIQILEGILDNITPTENIISNEFTLNSELSDCKNKAEVLIKQAISFIGRGDPGINDIEKTKLKISKIELELAELQVRLLSKNISDIDKHKINTEIQGLVQEKEINKRQEQLINFKQKLVELQKKQQSNEFSTLDEQDMKSLPTVIKILESELKKLNGQGGSAMEGGIARSFRRVQRNVTSRALANASVLESRLTLYSAIPSIVEELLAQLSKEGEINIDINDLNKSVKQIVQCSILLQVKALRKDIEKDMVKKKIWTSLQTHKDQLKILLTVRISIQEQSFCWKKIENYLHLGMIQRVIRGLDLQVIAHNTCC